MQSHHPPLPLSSLSSLLSYLLMNIFLSYIRDFFKTIHFGLLIFCLSYAALIIFLNYRYGIEPKILFNISNRVYRFAGFYLVYLAAFTIPYVMLFVLKGK